MSDLGWSLKQVVDLVRGAQYGGGNPEVRRVVTDSRLNVEGAMFVALRGENFDGHRFLRDAAEDGATSALVEKPIAGLAIPQVAVKNTLDAFQILGLARRWEFSGPLVAVTGSTGKTTTRKLIASILERRYVVHQPMRNYNNHIGVPTTLLDLEAQHEAVVLELGCSDFREIETLTKISDPTVALITNVGPAHLQKLRDLDGVAMAKGELFLWIKQDATAVVNLDDPRIAAMPVQAKRRITYGSGPGADVSLEKRFVGKEPGQNIVLDVLGKRVEAFLPLIGAHNATNALAAAAAAAAVGLNRDEITAGLAAAEQEPGRLFLIKTPSGRLIIDDTYNANPASMRAALAALLELPVKNARVAILGDMLELGAEEEKEHVALGRHIGKLGIDLLITMGRLGEFIDRGAAAAGLPEEKRITAHSHEQAADAAIELTGDGDALLIKGSHGMQMDKVVSELKKKEE